MQTDRTKTHYYRELMRMEHRTKKAAGTIALCAALPLISVTNLPLALIGGILAGICFINMPQGEVEQPIEEMSHDAESHRNRARPVTC